MSRKLTIEEVKEICDQIEKERGIRCLNVGEYRNSSSNNLKWLCLKDDYIWYTSYSSIKQGSGCPKCGGSLLLTKKEFIIRSNKTHENKYDYSKVIYTNARNKVVIICPVHGEFEQTPDAHLRGSGCKDCKGVKICNTVKIKMLKTIEKKFNKLEIEKKIKCLNLKDYVNAKYKNLIFSCEKNHIWSTSYDSIIHRRRCTLCNRDLGKSKQKKEINQFIKEAINIHGDKYDYSLVDYINCKTKIKIYCKKCKKYFFKTPSYHLKGSGCRCYSTAHNKYKIHQIKEICDQIEKERRIRCLNFEEYKNSHKNNLKWLCKENHLWNSSLDRIQRGSGCPSCSSGISERICKSVFEQLFDKPFNKVRPNWLINSKTGYKLELDGYNEELKIAFEHQGRQHYERNYTFYTRDKLDFEYQKEKDIIKEHVCKIKRIFLVIIPSLNHYLKKENLKDFIIDELKKQKYIYDYKKLENIKIDFSKIRNNKTEFYLEKMKKLVEENNGELISKNYINAKTKYKMKCKKHNLTFEMTYDSLQQDAWGCEKCTKEKRKQTKLKKYGNENYNNINKAKQTCLQKYGVDNPAKIKDENNNNT